MANPVNGNGDLVPASGRNAAGRFVGGNKIGPGRGRGSRNKLSEVFLSDLHRAWLRHGRKVLDHCARTAPESFLRAAVAVLPKAIDVETTATLVTRSELAVEVNDFREAWDRWGQVIGVDRELIENNEVGDDDQQSDSAA